MLARLFLVAIMMVALARCAWRRWPHPLRRRPGRPTRRCAIAPAAIGGRRRCAPQARAPAAAPASNARARPVAQASATSDAADPNAAGAAAAPPAAPRQPITRVTEGTGELPRDQGQVSRKYDISPYTVRVTTTNRPEQAIVDWILRKTGYEAWHSEPLGLLSANQRVLRVYHTPQMHAVVADVVDRFLNGEAESHAFSLRVVTIGHPGWRAKAQTMLHPVSVQTQGIQAWLVHREDAALLLAELRKRTDFREHSSPHLLVNNGQSTTVASSRARTYVRDITLRPDVWPAFQPEPAQFDEGFRSSSARCCRWTGGRSTR